MGDFLKDIILSGLDEVCFIYNLLDKFDPL